MRCDVRTTATSAPGKRKAYLASFATHVGPVATLSFGPTVGASLVEPGTRASSAASNSFRWRRVAPTLAKPWTAAKNVVAWPAAPLTPAGQSAVWYIIACAHRAGGANWSAVKRQPTSAGTESKAHAWTTSTPASTAGTPNLSCIRSMNSGSPHRST